MTDNLKYIDDLVRNVLKDRVVSSPQQSWETLEKKLPVVRFWQFNYRRFNAYYLASITAAIIILILLLPYFPGNVINNVSENNTKAVNITDVKPPLDEDNSATSISTVDTSLKAKTALVSPGESSETEYVQEKRNFQENKDRTFKNLISKITGKLSLEQAPQKTEIAINGGKQKKEEEQNIMSQLSYYDREKFYLQTLSTVGINAGDGNLKLSPGTLQNYNIIPGTVSDMLPKSPKYSAEIYFSPLYTYNQLSTTDNSYNELLSVRKNLEKPVISYSVGTNFYCMITDYLFIQSGIAYSRLGEKFFRNSALHVDTSFITVADSNTVWFVNIDSLGNGINYSIPYTYATGTYHQEQKYDTTLLNQVSSVNHYNYLEIPLIFGYQFNRPGISYSVKAGLITGFLLYASCKSIAANDSGTINDINSNLPFMKPVFSYTLATGISYQLSEKFYLTGEAYYRKNVTSIYKDYPLIKKYETYGFKFGVRYGF